MRVVLLTLLLVGGVTAVPIERGTEPYCEPGFTRFLPNVRYTYQYVATSVTGVTGTTNDTTGLKIEAKCDIEALGQCKHILKVRDVRLWQAGPEEQIPYQTSAGQTEFQTAVESYGLFFTVINGRVDKVLPDAAEAVYVTNFKRGILSALQLQFTEEPLTKISEVDVSGNCTSEYKIVKVEESGKELIKTKNLTQCAMRSHNISSLNVVNYDSKSTSQTPLNSTSVCRYIVMNHIKTVECSETHLLRPFSYQGAGVTTNVTLNLTLESTQRTYFFDHYQGETRRSNLLFEHTSEEETVPAYKDNAKPTKTILSDLITTLPLNETTPITATKFAHLVLSIRKLETLALRDIWIQFYLCDDDVDSVLTEKQCQKSQSFILDALTQCGTVPCMTFIIKAIRDYDSYVKPEHVTTLLSGMSLVSKPTYLLFTDVVDLLKKREDLPKTTLLSLGTMIRKYCQQAPVACNEGMAVTDAERFLENQLPEHCEATPETVDDVIVTLKAIGNAGRMRSKATELVKCSQGANYLNVSVVAIETIRRMPYCPDTWKSLKWDVFGEYSVDPEVRIQAYFALMKYPTQKTVEFVAEVLDREVNTQVGSLVYSHLTHMNESVEPTFGKSFSETIRKALKNRETPLRVFNTTRKSCFMQKSYFNDVYNLGVSSESHVIYHPESLLPRSAELNITADVFGGAFPVLETSTRFEGLEILWEKLFGHHGYFPDNHIGGLVDTPEEPMEDNYITRLEKRSTDNLIDVESLDKKINLRKMTPSGFLSLKLFGTELDIFTLKDLEWLREDDIPLADIIDILQKLSKGVEKTYTKSVVFLEETYVIPTCLGIPLNLSINGTAVGSVHLEGKADVRGLFWGKKSAFVRGTIKPSTAIVLSGQVTLDAIHCSTGVLLNSTISTSTEMEGNLTYLEGQGLKVHVNVTDKPQEILNITTALFQHVNNIKTPILGVSHRNTTGICTTDVFNSTKIFGLNLCSNISMPVAWYNKTTPFFPLTGPANFSIYLNKTDPQLKTFQVAMNVTNPDMYTNKTIISFRTPGASLERGYFWNITTNFTEEMSRWNISMGTTQQNATTVDYIHIPLFKAVNITVNVTSNLTVFYFHRTCAYTNRIKYGLALNTTLFNRSLHHTFFLMNDSNLWVLETNTTVVNATRNATLTVLYLNTTIDLNGNTTGNMTLNITHRPLNFTWYLRGLHNMTTLSTNVTLNVSCPMWNSTICNQNITINMTYLNTTNEYRTQVNISSNGTRVLSCSKASLNATDRNITTYYCNVTALNRTASWNMTVTNTTGVKICHLNITHRNRSITLNTTWMYSHELKNVSLNITYLNHSVVLSGSLKNFTMEKGFCFNSTYYSGTHRNFTLLATCLSYVNTTRQKSLIWNVTSLNSTVMVNSTWFANSTSRGILLNCTYQNRTIFNMTATYSNSTTTKNLHFNITAGNWTAQLNHTFFSTELIPDMDQISSINISHRIKNGTVVILNTTFTFTFFNTTTKKDVIVNLTFSNVTYGAQILLLNKTKPEMLHHVVRVIGYTPNKTVSWTGVFKNTTEIANLTSLLEYQRNKVLNHSLLWNKKINHVNVSLDILPNVTVSFNCSGTFNNSINATVNVTVYNQTMLWNGFVSNTSVVSNVTLWNRTIEFVTTTCNKTMSAVFNLSTWHHHDKTAFNGSVVWSVNATDRISFLNVSTGNVTLSMKTFSENETHINSTFLRQNGSEVYSLWSREFRSDGTGYEVLNLTCANSFWVALNNATFNIPAKLANITQNATVDGVNMTTFRTHLKFVLKKITQELLLWNYTSGNFTENLRNLTARLLNVTSRSLPRVTANYSIYINDDQMDTKLFYENLFSAVYSVSNSNVTLTNITEEIILIVQNFTDHINTTALYGNITTLIANSSWFNETLRNFTLSTLVTIDTANVWGQNITRNFSAWLNTTLGEIGNWTIANKSVNYYLKVYMPTILNFTQQLLNGTMNVTSFLQNITLAARNLTHNITEYFLNATHPVLYNITREILVNVTGYVNASSFLGGIVHPAWSNLSKALDVSLFNFTYELVHNWTLCNTSLEWFFTSLHHPVNVSWTLLNITSNKTLYESIEALVNRTLEVYNATVKTPASLVNSTHDWLVNVTERSLVTIRDVMNVVNITTNKTTQEIVDMYIRLHKNISAQMWNMTIYLLTSTNFSKPLNETWKLINFTSYYNNWTQCAPWTRPLLKTWNTSMFQIVSTMRNHTWQNYTRYYIPTEVKLTSYPIEYQIYLFYSFFDTVPYNTTINDDTIATSFAFPNSLKLNYTEYFYRVTCGYMNMTNPALNFTRNTTEIFLSSTYNFTLMALNTTINWTHSIYNLTCAVVNTTASFVNGSLVNETIIHHGHIPSSMYFTAMNFSVNFTEHFVNYTVTLVNKTVHELINMTLSPVITMQKTVTTLLNAKPEDIVEILQPENETAMTFGQRHFYTFDKRHFRFPVFKKRECQYLAARDFKDGNFTVTTDSESINVVTSDAQVKIYRSGVVKSHGITDEYYENVYEDIVRFELPVKFKNTTIVRDGPYINLTNDFGFSLECDMEHFVCSYIVSGFYHNRTLGLLGTNNGEPSDDWLSPSGKNRTELSDFVNSWLIRGDEECKVERDEQESCAQVLPTKRCEDLFLNESSPLRECFTTVNPTYFARACKADLGDCHVTKPSHCNVTAAYIRECRRHGIVLTLPDDCTTCEVNGVIRKENETWKQGPNKDVDVVVVLSESLFMESIGSLIPSFIKNLEDELKNQRLSPRFGLVGFSGKPPVHRPGHVHTIKGTFFGSAKEFAGGLKNMEFLTSKQEEPVNDGYLGLMKAAEYPFRPGATKIIVLVTNSYRLKDSNITMETVAETLKNISARLVVIGDYRYKSSVAVDTYKKLYTKKAVRGQPTPKYSADRMSLSDEYVQIVLRTQGVTVSLKRFESLPQDPKSWTVQGIHNSILQQVRDDRRHCKQCTCVSDVVGKGKTVCHTVYSCQ